MAFVPGYGLFDCNLFNPMFLCFKPEPERSKFPVAVCDGKHLNRDIGNGLFSHFCVMFFHSIHLQTEHMFAIIIAGNRDSVKRKMKEYKNHNKKMSAFTKCGIKYILKNMISFVLSEAITADYGESR